MHRRRVHSLLRIICPPHVYVHDLMLHTVCIVLVLVTG